MQVGGVAIKLCSSNCTCAGAVSDSAYLQDSMVRLGILPMILHFCNQASHSILKKPFWIELLLPGTALAKGQSGRVTNSAGYWLITVITESSWLMSMSVHFVATSATLTGRYSFRFKISAVFLHHFWGHYEKHFSLCPNLFLMQWLFVILFSLCEVTSSLRRSS